MIDPKNSTVAMIPITRWTVPLSTPSTPPRGGTTGARDRRASPDLVQRRIVPAVPGGDSLITAVAGEHRVRRATLPGTTGLIPSAAE
jgi:hypothetical protein